MYISAALYFLIASFAFAQQNVEEQVQEKADEGRSPSCHRRRHCNFTYREVKLRPNAGYYAFNFQLAGEPVKDAFVFHYGKPTVLSVFDCYCTGDGFEIYDSNVYVGSSEGPNDGNGSCTKYSEDPIVCYSDSEWSFFQGALNPGKHNITLSPWASPYRKGTAFLRVDDLCPLTPPPKANFGAVEEKIEEEAEEADQVGFIRCCEQTFNCSQRIVN